MKENEELIAKNSLSDLIENYSSNKVVQTIQESLEKGQLVYLPISSISPCFLASDKDYGGKVIDELILDIRFNSLKVPIIVYKDGERNYIIDGMKRYVAAKSLKINMIPCLCISLSEEDLVEYTLAKLRKNMDNPLIFATAFKLIEEKYNYKEKKICELTGFSHGQVANINRCKNLPSSIQKMIIGGKLNLGKAKLLVTFNEPEAIELANKFVSLSVRQCEELAREKRMIIENRNSTKPKLSYKYLNRQIIIDILDDSVTEDVLKYLASKSK